MARLRRPVHFAPAAWVAPATPRVSETPVDFDLDLNASDDPDAGFVYVESAVPGDIDDSGGYPQSW